MSVTRKITAVTIVILAVVFSLSTGLMSRVNYVEAREFDQSPWIATSNQPGSPRFSLSGHDFEPGIVLVQYKYELVKLHVDTGEFETTVVYQRGPEPRYETIVVIQGHTVLKKKIQIPGYEDLKVSHPDPEVVNFRDFIEFEGSGWRSNPHTSGIGKKHVTVVVSSSTHVYTEMIPTNQWGSFHYLYRIPPTLVAPDEVTFTFTDGKKSFIRTVEIEEPKLLDSEEIPVSTYRGTPGETLKIIATGLQPYASPEILIDGMEQNRSHDWYHTDREGSVETEIVLPNDLGHHTIVIRTAEHGGYAEAKAELHITQLVQH